MGNRGPKPKPTNILKLEGNPGKRSLNYSEPKPKAGATCPSWLGPLAKQEWNRIAPELEANNLLSKIDRAALAGYCQCVQHWYEAEMAIRRAAEIETIKARQDLDALEAEATTEEQKRSINRMRGLIHCDGMTVTTTNGNSIQNPYVGIVNSTLKRMEAFMNEFGMTPSARSRIVVNNKPLKAKEDDLDLFSQSREA